LNEAAAAAAADDDDDDNVNERLDSVAAALYIEDRREHH